MRNIICFICLCIFVCACDKHDPILPGERTAIFAGSRITVLDRQITDIPSTSVMIDNSSCPYSQDSTNVIWDGERRVFSGFPTGNTVAATVRPVCSGKYIYAGLTTGELVKLNPQTREIMWIADIYRTSNLTGGTPIVDIIVPVVPDGKFVYAGGLGDAFCKLSSASGAKQWCLDISVPVPFVIAGNYAFVVGGDNYLYAISTTAGDVYWRTPVDRLAAPVYQDGRINLGDEIFDVSTGKKVLDN